MEAFRVAPSSDQQCRRGVWSYAEDTDQGWRCRPGQSFQLGLQVVDLRAEFIVAAGQRAKSVLGRRRGVVQAADTEVSRAGAKRATGAVDDQAAHVVHLTAAVYICMSRLHESAHDLQNVRKVSISNIDQDRQQHGSLAGAIIAPMGRTASGRRRYGIRASAGPAGRKCSPRRWWPRR